MVVSTTSELTNASHTYWYYYIIQVNNTARKCWVKLQEKNNVNEAMKHIYLHNLMARSMQHDERNYALAVISFFCIHRFRLRWANSPLAEESRLPTPSTCYSSLHSDMLLRMKSNSGAQWYGNLTYVSIYRLKFLLPSVLGSYRPVVKKANYVIKICAPVL
jgi:hypothetical protein